MYYIQGKVTKINGEFAVIDANGIGYQLQLTKRLAKSLSTGKEKVLVCQINVHGQEAILYAFATPKERCLFTVLVRESMLAVERAFKIVSEGSDELEEMLRDFKSDDLQELGLTEDEVIMMCSRFKFVKFDIAQGEILEQSNRRKIIPMRENKTTTASSKRFWTSESEEPEETDNKTTALMDADGNSLVDQAVTAICQLRDIKPQQAEGFVNKAIDALNASDETPVQRIILKANEMARNA